MGTLIKVQIMKINKMLAFLSCTIFILIFGGIYYCFHDSLSENKPETVVVTQENVDTKDAEQETDKLETTAIYVHVCGAVKNPGVYEIMADSRICDAINAAGGLTKKAADTDINQAELLTDGQQVYIPYKSKNKEVSTLSDNNSSTDSSKVNINTATSAELTTLPGIGDAKATSILQYREENGKFASIEELKNVSGIKDGVYTQIEAYITV